MNVVKRKRFHPVGLPCAKITMEVNVYDGNFKGIRHGGACRMKIVPLEQHKKNPRLSTEGRALSWGL